MDVRACWIPVHEIMSVVVAVVVVVPEGRYHQQEI